MAARAHPAVTDKRLLRGRESRRAVLRPAVDLASLESLDALSFGRLAERTGRSKAGVQGLFRSKDDLQLATIAHAGELFADAVLAPTSGQPDGLGRLGAVLERWFEYAGRPVFEGGCFWATNLAQFDARPGPVQDALIADQAAWRGFIAQQVAAAVAAGQVGDLDPDDTSFLIDAVLLATNSALRIGEPHATPRARAAIAALLGGDVSPLGGSATTAGHPAYADRPRPIP